MLRGAAYTILLIATLATGCVERSIVLESLSTSGLSIDTPTLPVDANARTAVTVFVHASFGDVAGSPVTLLSAPAGPVFTQPPATDADGYAVGYLTCATAGTFVISAAVGPAGHAQRIPQTGTMVCTSTTTPLPTLTDITLTLQPNTLVADGVSEGTLTLTAYDDVGQPMVGQAATFTSAGSNVTVLPASGFTDALGTLTATVASTTTQSTTVTARAGAFTASAPVSFTLGTASSAQVVVSPNSIVAGNQGNVTITMYDAQGRTVPGEGVTLSANGSNTSFASSTGTTDSSGTYITTITSTVAQSETVTVSALPSITATATVTFVAATPSSAHCTVTANPNTNVVAGTSSSVTVNVADVYGNPILGQAVSLSASGGNNTFTPLNGNTVAGVFTASLKSTRAQNETILATIGAASASTTIDYIAASPNATTTSFAAAPTQVAANASSTSSLTVTVRDAYGNVVSGAAVTFGSSGTANTFTPPSGTTAVTGLFSSAMSSSKAEVKNAFVNVAGNFNETAVVTFVAGLPSSAHTTIVATPSSNIVAGTSVSLTVTVGDAFGNPVVGAPVTFSASGGGSNAFTPLNGNTIAGGILNGTLVSTLAQSENVIATLASAAAFAPISIIAGSPNSAMSSLVAAPTTVTANNSNTSTLTVTVQDAFENPVNNAAITFNSSGVSFAFAPPNGTTGTGGQLASNMTSTHAEVKTAFANVAGNFNETAAVTFIAGPPVRTLSSLTVTPASGILANGTASAAVAVHLVDQFHNAVPSWPLSLSTTDTSAPAFAVSANSDTSGSYATALTSSFAGSKLVTLHSSGFTLNATAGFIQPSAYCSNANGAFYGLPPLLTGLSNATHVVTALMNNDTFPDLIVADRGTNGIAMAYGLGNGRFSAWNTYSSGNPATTRVAVCDVTNDGFNDVFALNFTNGTVQFYTGSNDGSGSMASSTTVPMSGANIGNGSIACAALTGATNNPYRDIVVGSPTGKKIWVQLNSSGSYPGSAMSTSFSQAVYGLGVADLNGDGNRDAYFEDNAGHVLVATGLGNGLFNTPATSYTVLGTGVAVSACDLNNDGALDLVHAATSTNAITTLLNNGSGTFTVKGNFPVGLNPNSIACADFNGDSFNDVATTSPQIPSVTVLYGAGNGTFSSTVTYPQLGQYQSSITAADFNVDGHIDLAASYQSNGDSGVGLMFNTGSAFKAYKQLATDGSPVGVAAGDINGDGRLDLVVTAQTTNTAQVFLNAGAAQTFTASTKYNLTDQPVNVALVDLDNDGDLDMAVGLTSTAGGLNILLNAGGAFSAASFYAANGQDWGLGLGDFNSDGHADIVSGNRGSNTVTTLLGNATAAYSTNATTTIGTASNPAEVAVGDLNQDGNQDLAVALFNTTQVGTLFGNGDGTFSNPHLYSPNGAGSGGFGGVTITDLDLDGHPDVATSDVNGYLSTFMGSASGTLTPNLHFNAIGFLYLAVAADLNGDGVPDLMTARHSQASYGVYYGVGNGTFQPEIFYAAGNAPYSVAVADFDGDGHMDFAQVDESDNLLSVHYYSACP